MPAQSFPKTLPAIWIAGSIAAVIYALQQDIPSSIAVPAAAAFLVELSLYFEVRRIVAWPAAWLWASALAPYLIANLALGGFRWETAAALAGLAAAVAAWFLVAGKSPAAELLFLALMGGVYLAKPFRWIYPDPVEGLRIDALGQLMWIRIGIASLLRHRRAEEFGFGFLPDRREWVVGVRYFLLFLPVGAALALGTGFAGLRLPDGWWWKAPGTFFGILWVVALSEELFFRGLLQQRCMDWWGQAAGIAAASAVFGLAHLWFREFPNWRMALLAAVAGGFYGRAYAERKSVRASMVTHALTVTLWRTFFA